MPDFVRVAAVADLPPGSCRSIRIGLRRIAVFNIAGSFHAVEDACAHMKAPLSGGRIRGAEVTCARHGWVYDLATGRRVDKEGTSLRVYAVKVEAGAVYVGTAGDPAARASGHGSEQSRS